MSSGELEGSSLSSLRLVGLIILRVAGGEFEGARGGLEGARDYYYYYYNYYSSYYSTIYNSH